MAIVAVLAVAMLASGVNAGRYEWYHGGLGQSCDTLYRDYGGCVINHCFELVKVNGSGTILVNLKNHGLYFLLSD
eukprot:COSAG02_NODE_17446_length_1002_cov_3.031008_1_plen_74_part_10